MIEALILVLELAAVFKLLRNIHKNSNPNTDSNLGIFSYHKKKSNFIKKLK